jgi:CBS domain-containing protein
MTIAAILKNKGADVLTVGRTATLSEVTVALAQRRVGIAVVVGPGGAVEGVVSERDLIRKLAAHGAAALAMTAEETMTRNVVTASPGTTVEQAMAVMSAGRFRHLPILDKGALVGIISIRDAVGAKVGIQETEVESLRAYVTGQRGSGH